MMLGRFSRSNGVEAAPVVETFEPIPVEASSPQQAADDARLALKLRVHRRIIDEVDLTLLDAMAPDEMRRAVVEIVRRMVGEERLALNTSETHLLAEDVLNEMKGLGPIEGLLKDDSVNDILINTHAHVYVERKGILEATPVRFADESHLLRIINRIVSSVGRRVDESQPMVDARLADGSRVNAIVPPLAVDGSLVSIRKFARLPFTTQRLVDNRSLPKDVADFLMDAVRTRVTLIVSGGTGSGKTTLLNALSAAINSTERLITIEDAAELQLQQPHVARLETRPPNVEGRGEVRQRELVKNALRMRPDRIIIGECRGDEAFDMLQAMNTGHEGSLSTIHANSPRDALMRLEQMVALASLNLTPQAVRQQISSAIQLILQVQRMQDGKRRLVAVAELVGMEGNVVQLQEIFRYRQTGVDESGALQGQFEATGLRPQCVEWMRARGADVKASLFDPKPLGV